MQVKMVGQLVPEGRCRENETGKTHADWKTRRVKNQSLIGFGGYHEKKTMAGQATCRTARIINAVERLSGHFSNQWR